MNNIQYPDHPVVLIDDEEQVLESIRIILKSSGYNNLYSFTETIKAFEFTRARTIAVILLDLNIPGMSGEEFLEKAVSSCPDIPIIVITGKNTMNTAIDCMKRGAYDFLAKPIRPEQLLKSVKHAVDYRTLYWDNLLFKDAVFSDKIHNKEAFSKIITKSPVMFSIFNYIEAVAKTIEPVLITGDTGVGKELIAETIHTISNRKGEYVKINISSIDETLFADMLFGHRKGAFTGAAENKIGLIEKAAHGTLLLDEIGDLSLKNQIKLLRLLEEREYYPVGSNTPMVNSARILLATNHDIPHLIEQGLFRKDLYYRIQTHRIKLPALKKRKEDIPLLVHHFVDEASCDLQKKKPVLPKELFTLFSIYDFPGNIRELRSIVFNMISLNTTPVLSTEPLRKIILSSRKNKEHFIDLEHNPCLSFSDIPTLKEAEDFLIDKAMLLADNNQRIAAEILGINRKTLNAKLRKRKSPGGDFPIQSTC